MNQVQPDMKKVLGDLMETITNLPEDCYKPWVQLDKLPYLHATEDAKARPYSTPVIGRFDYLPTMDYVKQLHPRMMARIIQLALTGLQQQDDWR